MKDFVIPDRMKHMKQDSRGYPIPFFVPIIDGVPDFRLLDFNKQKIAVDKELCGICGRKLHSDYCYWISGPQGLKNRISSDPAMHRECAEFALNVCPHLVLQRAERRDKNVPRDAKIAALYTMISDKPGSMFLVKTKTRWHIVKSPVGQNLLRYSDPVATFEYKYVDGILVSVNQ